MAFGDDLVAYIDSNSTALTAGTSLFKNAIIETTGRAVFVVEVRGQSPQEKFGGTLPAYTQPSADVIVRSTIAAGGPGIAASTGTRSLAQNVWGILNVPVNTNVNSVYYERISPQTDPYYMGHDDQGRALFGFTVDAMRAPSTS